MDPFLAEFSSTVFLATPPADGWPARFAVITACNEHGDHDAEEKNRMRTAELRQELVDAGIAFFPATGCSRDLTTHCELGYGCEMDLATAVSFGKRFNQVAVFWIEHNALELVYVESGQRYPLDSWSVSVKGPANHS